MQKNWVTKLSADLGLDLRGQDWGIENADPQRIIEFITYYRTNTKDEEWESEALAELIFQSFEEACESGSASEEEKCAVLEFAAAYSEEFPHTLNYWRSLKPEDWHLPRILN